MNEGRGTVPWLNLLPDDHLYLSVVFAPVLDERFDGSIEVVGQFTAGRGGISLPVLIRMLRNAIGVT